MQDFDYSNDEVVNYDVADTGIYELVIENAELKKSEASGKEYIGLTISIREDVDQPFAGCKIWDNIWRNLVYRNPQLNNKRIKKADYDAMSPEQKQNIISRMEYDDIMIKTFVHAQDADKFIKDGNGNDIPNPNYNAKFSSIDEVALFLNGLPFQAKVTKYTDDRTGKERNSIDYKTVKRTSVHLSTSNEQNVNVDDEEDDLPF